MAIILKLLGARISLWLLAALQKIGFTQPAQNHYHTIVRAFIAQILTTKKGSRAVVDRLCAGSDYRKFSESYRFVYGDKAASIKEQKEGYLFALACKNQYIEIAALAKQLTPILVYTLCLWQIKYAPSEESANNAAFSAALSEALTSPVMLEWFVVHAQDTGLLQCVFDEFPALKAAIIAKKLALLWAVKSGDASTLEAIVAANRAADPDAPLVDSAISVALFSALFSYEDGRKASDMHASLVSHELLQPAMDSPLLIQEIFSEEGSWPIHRLKNLFENFPVVANMAAQEHWENNESEVMLAVAKYRPMQQAEMQRLFLENRRSYEKRVDSSSRIAPLR